MKLFSKSYFYGYIFYIKNDLYTVNGIIKLAHSPKTKEDVNNIEKFLRDYNTKIYGEIDENTDVLISCGRI